jgi:hypothetical protein
MRMTSTRRIYIVGFCGAGWGNGHEGVGIEILEMSFVKVRDWTGFFPFLSLGTLTILLQGGMAHRTPGLGWQNRKQRLGEYAAERGAVLGFAASAAVSGAVGGRTKRARGVGVGGSGAPDSDMTDEDMDSEEIEEEEEEDMDVDALTAHVTIVFEGGRNGALHGYVSAPRPFMYFGSWTTPSAKSIQFWPNPVDPSGVSVVVVQGAIHQQLTSI